MSARWLYDTTACVDCYMTAALGAPSDDPDYVPAAVPLSSVAPGECVELGWRFPTDGMRDNPDGDCVLGFSRVPCECCGGTLGGDRFAVSVWCRDGAA